MARTADIRRWALALPEVEESTHFRFRAPVFKVHGRTFAGLTGDRTMLVVRISESRAAAEAAADPSGCEAVRRTDATRSFLGLQLRLDGTPAARVRGLLEEAWREQAPKRLVSAFVRDR